VADGEKRVELVSDAEDDNQRSQRIGIGLLLSLIVGSGPLGDALNGNGSFEHAIGRYLLTAGACVGATLVLGRLLDTASEPEAADEPEAPEP
jgi:hypothetical protein